MLRKHPANYFILGILSAALLCGPLILDLTLVPRYLGLSVFLCLTLGALFLTKHSLQIPRHSVLLFYTLYTIVVALSGSWSINLGAALFEAGKQCCVLLVLCVCLHGLHRWPNYTRAGLLKISVVVFYIGFIFAIIQISGITSLNKEAWYEVTGINGHKNLYSSFLFLNLFFLWQGFKELNQNWRYSTLWGALLSLLLIALLRTKAVYLGLAVAAPVYMIVSATRLRFGFLRSPKAFAVSAAVLVVVINLFFMLLLPKLIPQSAKVVKQTGPIKLEALKLEEERLVLWEKTYTLIHQKPLLGCGAGNWQVNMPDATLSGLWRGEDLNYTFQRPHNDWLWILSENGYVGFNALLIALVILVLGLLRALPADENKTQRKKIALSLSVLLGFFIISFFDFPKERIEHSVWFALILAFSLYPSSSRKFSIKPLHSALLLGVFLFIAYTAILRYNGEYYTRRLLNDKQANNPARVVRHGHAAMSFAYSLDPTSVPIYWYTGNAEILLGHSQNAQRDFIKAQQLNPYNRHVLNDLGSAYVYNNHVIAAKACYEEAARISPRFDDPKLNLAALYINAGDYQTADRWLKSILHDSPRRTSYQTLVDNVLKNQTSP